MRQAIEPRAWYVGVVPRNM